MFHDKVWYTWILFYNYSTSLLLYPQLRFPKNKTTYCFIIFTIEHSVWQRLATTLAAINFTFTIVILLFFIMRTLQTPENTNIFFSLFYLFNSVSHWAHALNLFYFLAVFIITYAKQLAKIAYTTNIQWYIKTFIKRIIQDLNTNYLCHRLTI